jgi:hypothetical protein
MWRFVLATNVPDERATSIFTSSNLKMEAVYSSETFLVTPNLGFATLILFFRGAVKMFLDMTQQKGFCEHGNEPQYSIKDG